MVSNGERPIISHSQLEINNLIPSDLLVDETLNYVEEPGCVCNGDGCDFECESDLTKVSSYQ